MTVLGLCFDIYNIIRAIISLAFLDVICSILGWLLAAYLLLVVWSFKKEIEEGAGGDHLGEVHNRREQRC